MKHEEISFHLGEASSQFAHLSKEVMLILQQRDGVYSDISAVIESNLQELNNRAILKLAFIGQYSSGKSSIISALTGNRHIKIDADIATDQATEYQWNGITLTDTPGLYTDRMDHDELTYDVIRASDLLVFVITSDLFDEIILDNFIKLAYQDGYRHKMNLVVNKMSMEPGDFEELKENYLETLAHSLHPYQILDLDISFIDAADYLEGVNRNRLDYKEMSHFDEFIHQLNEFTAQKGLLGKLDTPFRVVLSEIDRALIEAGSSSDQEIFNAMLNRIQDRIQKSVKRAEIHLSWLTGELRAKIVKFGSGLSAKVGEPQVDIEGEAKQIEVAIEELVQETSNHFEQLLQEEQQLLNEQITEILESDLGEAFFHQIQHSAELNVSNIQLSDLSTLQANFNTVSSIVNKASGGFLQMTMSGAANQAGYFFSSTATAGTNLHKGVYTVGKFFGHNFKPWGAVNLAAKLGNVIKVLGPILSIASVIFEMIQMGKENSDLRKVIAAKQECMNNFIDLAESIELEFQRQFGLYKQSFYYDVLDEITERRAESIRQSEMNSDFERKLLEYRGEFLKLLQKIHGVNPVHVGG